MGLVLVCGGFLAAVPPAGEAQAERRPQSPPADALINRQDVAFTVTNPDDGAAHRISAYRYDPPCVPNTVVLLLHGPSYTKSLWDVARYSVARPFAHAGYAVVAIDRLGYGASPLEDGRKVSVAAYAEMTRQLVDQLHHQGFFNVVVAAQGLGAESAEIAGGLSKGIAALLVLGYTHFPSPEFTSDFHSGDVPRSLVADYEYFLGTPSHRAEMLFTADADPGVVRADSAAAVPTPSGEIQSLFPPPSRAIVGSITVPVYLQLAQHDRLFPSQLGRAEAALFRSAPQVVVDVVPAAGHTAMLHPSAGEGTFHLVSWVRNLPVTPPCS
ncbi:MAG TPA: alpha/beta hydrolase [Acidimicrobiia bacterium]|nr:alpha/beta hydrolase [Acidimicrobiia bacterium]